MFHLLPLHRIHYRRNKRVCRSPFRSIHRRLIAIWKGLKALTFVNRFYNVEHTLSFEDVVEDLTAYCHRKGGRWYDTISRF